MTATGATLALLPVEAIQPNPANRPEGSGAAEMSDLVASVQALGILEPLIVRPAGPGRIGYLLMAGERRWAAAKLAGQLQVPAMVWHGVRQPEITDLLVILTENWQRVPMSRGRGRPDARRAERDHDRPPDRSADGPPTRHRVLLPRAAEGR